MSTPVPQIDPVSSFLYCPRCGNDWGCCLHHGRVTIINRIQEDGDGWKITVIGGLSKCERVSSEEIDGRRDVMYIEFRCENCSGSSLEPTCKLRIMQHKGATYLEWQLLELPALQQEDEVPQ